MTTTKDIQAIIDKQNKAKGVVEKEIINQSNLINTIASQIVDSIESEMKDSVGEVIRKTQIDMTDDQLAYAYDLILTVLKEKVIAMIK